MRRVLWIMVMILTGVAVLPLRAGTPPARRKVVCMTPAFTEICFGLGCGERVVGVTDFCDYPPAALKKPRVGGFLNPNMERIVTLQPDLVLLVPEEESVAERLKSLGIETAILPLYSLEDITAAVRRIADLLGVKAAGQALTDRMRREVRRAAADHPVTGHPSVLLIVGRNLGDLSNIYVAGPGTFLGELLRAAGGRNVYRGDIRYPTLSLESLAELNPDVIIELYPGLSLSSADKRRLIGNWARLDYISAVRRHRVYILDDSFIVVPGPRIARTLAVFRRCLGESP